MAHTLITRGFIGLGCCCQPYIISKKNNGV